MMRKKRGIVCEKKKHYTILLTGKGEFLRGIPLNKKSDIGDEVDFRPVHGSGKRRPLFFGALAVAAVFLFFFVTSLIPSTDKAMAYVQLETDQAMELVVGEKGKVISLRQLNGPSGLETRFAHWKGQPLRLVLDNAIQELPIGEGQVIITTISLNDPKKVEGIVSGAVLDVKRKHRELIWKINESTVKDRLIANKEQMSIHAYKESKMPGYLQKDQVEEETLNSNKQLNEQEKMAPEPEEQGESNPVIHPEEQKEKQNPNEQVRNQNAPKPRKEEGVTEPTKQPAHKVPPVGSGQVSDHPGKPRDDSRPNSEEMELKKDQAKRSNPSSTGQPPANRARQNSEYSPNPVK